MEPSAVLALDKGFVDPDLRRRIGHAPWPLTDSLVEEVRENITRSLNERADLLRPSDISLDDHLRCMEWFAPTAAEAGFISDAFGIRTRTTYAHKWADLDGTVQPWGFRSCFEHDVLEWACLLKAIDRAGPSFRVVEIGAGWGPWVTAASVFARRKGITDIQAIAVEADPKRHAFIREHMANNGVGDVPIHATLGAVTKENGEVLFPVLEDSTKDMGFAARPAEGRKQDEITDYRGVKLTHRAVPAYSLEHVIANVERVDFMHIDIQGAEADVVESAAQVLRDRCAHILCATHARDIEWSIASTLMKDGWVLERESPCEMHSGTFWANSGRDFPLVSRDGTQFWRNPLLVEA